MRSLQSIFCGFVEIDYQQDAHQLSRVIAAAILIFAGCAPKVQRPMRVCPSTNLQRRRYLFRSGVLKVRWRLELTESAF